MAAEPPVTHLPSLVFVLGESASTKLQTVKTLWLDLMIGPI